MKKFILMFLATFMFTTIVPNDIKAADSHDSFYVNTTRSIEADDFVKNSLFEHILALDNSYQNINEYEIGRGILITNNSSSANELSTYHYPVFLNEEMKYVFRVADDGTGSYTGSLSESLVKEYNEISIKTSYSNPANIFIENDNLLASINGNFNIIFKNPGTTSNDRLTKSDSVNTVGTVDTLLATENVFETEKITLPEILKQQRGTAAINLAIDYKEKQTTLPWCSAYVTANALRYIKKDPNITYSLVAGNTSTENGVPNSRLIEYCKTKGVVLSFKSGIIDPFTVRLCLEGNKPIQGRYTIEGKETTHALLIHGINYGNTIYTVKNPWDTYSTTYSASGNTYVSQSSIMHMIGYGLFS